MAPRPDPSTAYARVIERELRIEGDLAAAAARVFVQTAPRSVALAGGATPRPLYERLATSFLGYPWQEVDVFFGDERCVPPDHADSNLRMANESLLSRLLPKGPRVHPMPGASCDAAAYEKELSEAFGTTSTTFDLVILGLGADGHTASLFPGDPALNETERLVVRVERPDHPRLTLTLPALSAAKQALFLVAGEAKREALTRLMDGDEGLPAPRVHSNTVLVLAEPDAASHLTGS
ncbi:MAG: 6-phosphogluconolactonase [Actinomycetota bacterium]